ncbi:YecA family protein [Enterobacter hormaechei]|uniref:YecA family protein n=2 Tax=Enterobacter hormaechei TaxID=158836 RepID=UPI003B5EE892
MMSTRRIKKLTDSADDILKKMESTASNIRSIIVSMPPEDLIGYIYCQYMMNSIREVGDNISKGRDASSKDILNDFQFILEYVHAVLASDIAPNELKFDEVKCNELFRLCSELRQQAMVYAISSSVKAKEGLFGPDTADIEFHAKSVWVMLRGNRYLVLEEEFYRYVLSPHDDVLKEIYGISGAEIAAGFQDIANTIRTGHSNAIEKIKEQLIEVQIVATQQGKPVEEVMRSWVEENSEQVELANQAASDIFRGGIANLSKHTNLPNAILADLAYERGEESDFFAAGDFSGTPYRTLPARKKPLLKLDSGYYAVDPCFIRDSGYRSLLHNLLQRKPEYAKEFKNRQKIMSEGAFYDILKPQFSEAKVFNEIYYKDPENNQWSENDTLILMDDVLFLVEAKAGAAATIASPATDFKRHAQSVQDLVIKAYKQCERFFNYLASEEEVSLYQLVDGKYKECGRIKYTDYRLLIPIGLTVESFSPFSSFCKQLPQIKPLLGQYGFISMSIDDLFVLKRFLPSTGAFVHYMEVRQAFANVTKAFLYDEFDHLGAYITKNRYDFDSIEQLKKDNNSMLLWNGMSDIVDSSFEGEDWKIKPLPVQDFPNEVLTLLEALENTRSPGWLSVDSQIRNYDAHTRSKLGIMLRELWTGLEKNPGQYLSILDEENTLFVWIQNAECQIDWKNIHEKASAVAIYVKQPIKACVMVEIESEGKYSRAVTFELTVPLEKTDANAHVYEEVERLKEYHGSNPNIHMALTKLKSLKKVGRNEACPCGSGKKYKRCHGQ